MKPSNIATVHILVKANTSSEWDNCEFAIIHLSQAWKKEQTRRIELVEPLQEDNYFSSMNFYDTAVDFYKTGEGCQPNVDKMLSGKEWIYVELDEREQETFALPESSLDCYRLVLRANGTAYYTAYGKHTGDEFWTEEFDLNILCSPDTEGDELERLCMERFRHLTNAQLVAKVNGMPYFGWDDEGAELRRRCRVSKGAFDYAFRGNKLVILKDDKPCR